jgi:hypothetical protein
MRLIPLPSLLLAAIAVVQEPPFTGGFPPAEWF